VGMANQTQLIKIRKSDGGVAETEDMNKYTSRIIEASEG